MTLETSLELDVSVEFTHHKASKGQRDSMGVPLEPDEPEMVEINSVKFNGTELGPDFPAKVYDAIEEQCLEHVRNLAEAREPEE